MTEGMTEAVIDAPDPITLEILRNSLRSITDETYIALTKADSGRGLVAGASVACIAMISDRLISAWSRRRKRELGLD